MLLALVQYLKRKERQKEMKWQGRHPSYWNAFSLIILFGVFEFKFLCFCDCCLILLSSTYLLFVWFHFSFLQSVLFAVAYLLSFIVFEMIQQKPLPIIILTWEISWVIWELYGNCVNRLPVDAQGLIHLLLYCRYLPC